MTTLTVFEARAILIADEALQLSFEQRSAQGPTMDLEEGDAWIKLVARAHDRIAAYEAAKRGDTESNVTPYPGGNEASFQTLFCEAMAQADEKRTKTVSVLACDEQTCWVVQAIEQDIASQGTSLLDALADLGRMLDARDQLIAESNEPIMPVPRAPAEYQRALAEGRYVGILPLGLVRIAQIYLGTLPLAPREAP